MTGRLAAWGVALLVGVAGLAGIVLDMPWGPVAVWLGGCALALLAAGASQTSTWGWAAVLAGLVATSTVWWMPAGAAVGAIVGTQAVLAGLSTDTGRSPTQRVPKTPIVVGHGLGLAGLAVVWQSGQTTAALACLAGAWASLSLAALASQWRGDHHVALDEHRYLLCVLGFGAALVLAWQFWPDPRLPGILLVSAVVIVVAGMAAPFAGRDPPVSMTGQAMRNGIAFFLILNIVAIAIATRSAAFLQWMFLAMTAWLVLAVAIELCAWAWSRRRTETPESEIPPMEVLITGKNEAATLDAAMEQNIMLPEQVRFVLAVAANSTDDLVGVAHAWARRHPNRVRAVMGPGSNKATDLSIAWNSLRSDWVLLLDADEVVTEASLRKACSHIDPEVSIIQGRKANAEHDPTGLSRFISVERRFSTMAEHPFWADLFDAGHFAGSAALIRRDVPPALGLWKGDTLTEDIEFSVRFHLADKGRHVYDREFVVEEGSPRTFLSLLKQRARWARGWSEVASKHLATLVLRPWRAGWRTSFGLSWQLLTSVSAPVMAVMPGLTIAWILAGRPGIPASWQVALALFILPARLITYPTTFFLDHRAERRRDLWDVLTVALSSYLWIVVGWFIQLHALYLELSGARRTWHATDKITPR